MTTPLTGHAVLSVAIITEAKGDECPNWGQEEFANLKLPNISIMSKQLSLSSVYLV